MLVVINSYQTKRPRAFSMLSSRLVPEEGGASSTGSQACKDAMSGSTPPTETRNPRRGCAAVELSSLQAVPDVVLAFLFGANKHRQAARCSTAFSTQVAS